MQQHITRAAFALFVAGFAGTVSVSAQENYTTWSHHRDVFLNTTATTGGANVTGNVRNFPVLIRLTAKDSASFKQALAGGADLRFTKAGDVVRLKHQIDTWDTATKTAAVWVLVDTVYGNNKTQKIRMHWGKAGAADSSGGSAVFSNGFTNVWHLGNAAGIAPRPNAIAGGNPATPTNFLSTYVPVAGLIGKAEYLRGGPGGADAQFNDYLNLGTITTNYDSGFTFSAWLKNDVLGTGTMYYSASENTTDGAGIIAIGMQGTDASGGAKFRQRNAASSSNAGIINGDAADLGLVSGAWMHMVYTLGTDLQAAIYVNGALVASGAGNPAYPGAFSGATRTVNQLGTTLWHMNYNDNGFNGVYDEARLANVSRSADWVKLEHANQKFPNALAYFDSAAPVPVSSGALAHKPGFSVKSSSQGLVFQVGEYSGSARLTLVDMWGRTVWKSGFAAGSRRLDWDGRAASGSRAAPGLYIARVEWTDKQGRAAGAREMKVPLTR